MNYNLEGIAPEKADLIKSLRELDISDKEIATSLNIPIEDEPIQKSIEEQMAEKQAELDELAKSQNSKNGSDLNSDLSKIDGKIDDLNKSVSDQLDESIVEVDKKFEGLIDLVKSLAGKVGVLTENNEQLIKDNDDLKKSFSGSEEVLRKLANYTLGLKSMSNANYVERFEKSTTDDGKEVLSVSKHKNEISSRLSAKMDEPEFMKSLGDDISNFECSGKISPKLQKAFVDDLGIEVVA